MKQICNIHLKCSANTDIIKLRMSAHKTFILMQFYCLEYYRRVSLEIFCTSQKNLTYMSRVIFIKSWEVCINTRLWRSIRIFQWCFSLSALILQPCIRHTVHCGGCQFMHPINGRNAMGDNTVGCSEPQWQLWI